MHLYDLPTQLRNELLTTAVGVIRPVILIAANTRTALMFTADGRIVWSNGYERKLWQDIHRLLDAPIQLSASKPVLPNDGQNENLPRATEVSLQFLNPDLVFSATQNGAMLDPAEIEQAEFELYAQVGGQPYLLPMYKGRAVGLPLEEHGKTTFTIRDNLWELVRTPVLYGKAGGFNDQQTMFQNGQEIHNTVTVGSGSSAVELFDGITIFREDGQVRTSVSNSDPAKIVIQKIIIGNEALLGKYTIEFVTSTEFKITYPDNEFLLGNINSLYNGGNQNITIVIPAASWVVQQVPDPNNQGQTIAADPTGVEIEFFVSSVMKGNPVAIIELLLEWGLTENWGSTPTKPASLPVDWDAFNDVRQFYTGFTVYMDATNKDNEVWLMKKGRKPRNILALCQQVADHIGAQITVDNFGFVSISAPGVFPRPARLLSDTTPCPAIEAIRVMPQERANYYVFKYAHNSLNNNSAASLFYDVRTLQTDERVEKVLSFPFYKQNVSLWEMQSMGDIYMDTMLRSFVRIEMRIKPNWVLPIVPGDRFRVVTSQPPLLDIFVEVYSVDKTLGGSGIVRAFKIQEPRERVTAFCSSTFCASTFC